MELEIKNYKDKSEYISDKGVKSVVYLMDCMELMKQLPDGYIPLCVCDPPYGIGEDGSKNHTRGKLAKSKNYKSFWGNDTSAPEFEFWSELFRVSKNQIVWGANHFISRIPYDSSCWIVWDKDNGLTDFADCELAWTSYKSAVRKFKHKWQGMLQENMKTKEIRIHPTQKPVALFDWTYKNYATECNLILDTHLGSGSSRIAAEKAGINFIGCEIDSDYFYAQEKRFKDFTSQLRLF